MLKSFISLQRVAKGVKLAEICKNRFNLPPKTIFREKQQSLLMGNTPLAGQYYSLLQRRNYESLPKSDDSERFIYKGIAKCMNTVDTVTTSKDYLLAKRTLNSMRGWFKVAFQKYIIEHWWVQHTIKEFNRKLTNARRQRALKQIVK